MCCFMLMKFTVEMLNVYNEQIMFYTILVPGQFLSSSTTEIKINLHVGHILQVQWSNVSAWSREEQQRKSDHCLNNRELSL